MGANGHHLDEGGVDDGTADLQRHVGVDPRRRPSRRAVSRCWRRRRTTFSMSMMASSTMSPRAITNPAKIMVLIVAPRAWRISPAVISDSGMATTLISAVRHS